MNMPKQEKSFVTNKDRLLERKKSILKERGLTLVRTFDTFEKTSGEKDVCLCENKNRERAILRIGETRPAIFFPDGYEGEHIAIPKIFESASEGIVYEIEEYMEGDLISDIDHQNHRIGKLDSEITEKLLATFWEFQDVASSLPLEQKFDKEKVKKHFEKAQLLLNDPRKTKGIIDQHADFWEGSYPAKWKFACDNLIYRPDGKIGFIDNVNVGLRYFGYDLGWLIWPGWVEMKTEDFEKTAEHIEFLQKFMQKAYISSPQHISRIDFQNKFWLMMFERALGGVSDVARNVRHLTEWDMGTKGNDARKKKHVDFLNTILSVAMDKIR